MKRAEISDSTASVVWLAFLSGVPALTYQVVWTRQVGLLAGGQIGAVSIVLVAFFGGLAVGAAFFGSRADLTSSPLRLYGLLEVGAGLAAAFSVWALQWLGQFPELGDFALLSASATILFPSTFLLGGTLPALLRIVSSTPASAPRQAGRLIGFNTIGSVLGVGLAVFSIPTLGLRACLFGAATGSIAIGVIALLLARPLGATPQPRRAIQSAPTAILVAAFMVGVGTLGFEVVATRLATLRLGSTLYAWGFVLSLFLVGLAIGHFAIAKRARSTANPTRDLGAIEVAAACSVALGLAFLRPELASPTSTLTMTNLFRVALAILPGAILMGAAFPMLVRLAVRDEHVSTAFGRISAVNTLGGVSGALLAPFVLLPSLGIIGTGATLAAANAMVGVAFLSTQQSIRTNRPLAFATACLTLAGTALLRAPQPPDDPWVLFVREGRQATAVVTNSWGNRTLIVDGDPEAAATGHARRTEELLAVLPLLLHPAPHRFLEIGLGSGITLGTATRFPLDQIDCVEIAESVIRAARFFEPDNRWIAAQEKATIFHNDARRLLALRPDTYDVISANTLHPWSIGSTGLYSHEYFLRMAKALRLGGIAVQWIPTQQIGEESVSLILRTFFDVFPEGGLWWGAGNIIAVGAREPIPVFQPDRANQRMIEAELSWQNFEWQDASDLPSHRIATANNVRTILGTGTVLLDDRPLLELYAARSIGRDSAPQLHALLVAIARESVGQDAMIFWLESLERRAAGDESGANAREGIAADLGLGIAKSARTSRLVASAHQDLRAQRIKEALDGFTKALAEDPSERYALFGRAGVEVRRGRLIAAIADLERIVTRWPDDVRAWNELAGVFSKAGKLAKAQHAIDQALAANPYDVRALTNAGLIALERQDPNRAAALLARIRAVSPLGQSSQEAFLARAIEELRRGF